MFIFSLIHGAINAVLGDVLGGSGGGFGRFWGMFWEVWGEVWGRFLDIKNLQNIYKKYILITLLITLLIPIPIFAVLKCYFFIVIPTHFRDISEYFSDPPSPLFRNDAAALPPRRFRSVTC